MCLESDFICDGFVKAVSRNLGQPIGMINLLIIADNQALLKKALDNVLLQP